MGAQRGPNRPQATPGSALGLNQTAGFLPLPSRVTLCPTPGLGSMSLHPRDAPVAGEFNHLWGNQPCSAAKGFGGPTPPPHLHSPYPAPSALPTQAASHQLDRCLLTHSVVFCKITYSCVSVSG